MSGPAHMPLAERIAGRAGELYRTELNKVARWTSRLFAVLLPAQWVAAVALATWVSPAVWGEPDGGTPAHVWMAVLLGAAVIAFPVWLALRHPTWRDTPHVIAVAQMVTGGILIHVTGGRIETHFHVFGSLAFLSFYRNWRPLVTASLVAGADHILRGVLWPQSVYGVTGGAEWRWMEHLGWVVFEDLCLLVAVLMSGRDMAAGAEREAEWERTNEMIEMAVQMRTAELRASEERYRLLFESNPHPMWLFAPTTNRVLAVNDAAVTHYGYTREQFLRMTIADLEVPDTASANPFEFAPLPGGIVQLRHHRRAFGDVRQMELAAHPIEFDGQDATLVLAVDVTERTELEGQLKQAQKLESIGQLAAGVAHEINTPIQYIGDNTQFLGDAIRDLSRVLAAYRAAGGDPDALRAAEAEAVAADLDYLMEEAPKALDQTKDGVSHVARIVKAMKTFAHPGTTEKTLVDLNAALETVITVSRNEWKYVSEVVTKFDPSLPAVRGLPGELNQVFLNLLVNAAHAVKSVVGESGAKGTITITTRRIGTLAEVLITDTGCGIPDAIRGRIFDPFFTTKPVGQGTGQGLAIAHTVVSTMHEGLIAVESEVGKGTTFVVRLPINGQRLKQSERIRTSDVIRMPAKREVMA